MALATAIMNTWGYKGLFREFVHTVRARQLRVLEINTAGALTQFLSLLPKHKLRIYPDIDMMNIKINTGTFDLVVHSDTLEHISDPVQGLRECWRILKPRGHCVFTVPIIYRRLTLNRAKKAPSYHGNPEEMKNDQVVFTEYGADAWVHVIQAGFPECRIVSLEFPAAQALVAIKY
jgi:SAM-dependent methyltransferase